MAGLRRPEWPALVRGEDGTDGLALFRGKLLAEGGGLDDLLALVSGHCAEIADGGHHENATLRRQGMGLLHRTVPLLLLLRGKTFQTFDSVEVTATLLWTHRVERSQLLAEALLGLRGKFAEAGQSLEGAFLLVGREVFVVLHPLLDMRTDAGVMGVADDGRRGGSIDRGRRRLDLGGRSGAD